MILVLSAGTAHADGSGDGRAKAAEETREALRAYRQALESEVRQLEGWCETANEGLRDEREAARRKLDQLADEATHLWDRARDRMDSVVDDLKRKYGEARSKP